MSWSSAATLPSSALALASVLHLALALVRKHRSGRRSWLHPVILPSFVLAISPWILPTARGIAIGLGAHLAWFVACEIFARPARTGTRPPQTSLRLVEPIRAGSPASAARPAGGGAGATAPARPSGFVPARVLAVLDETPDIRTFRIERPEGFVFQAGQFLTVGVEVNGQRLTRCYSISSPPEATGYLEMSIKRQGLVSAALHATARAGTSLSVRPPAGRFVYPAGDARPLVLLAGGVGCIP